MANLLIEGIPDGLLARFVARAAAQGRCVNSELIVLVARALAGGASGAGARPGGPGGAPPPSGGRGRQVGWGGDATVSGPRSGA